MEFFRGLWLKTHNKSLKQDKKQLVFARASLILTNYYLPLIEALYALSAKIKLEGPVIFTKSEINKLDKAFNKGCDISRDINKAEDRFLYHAFYGEAERYIYFIKCESTPYIKIGISNNVKKRRGELQTGCPFPLTVLAYSEADYSDVFGEEIKELEEVLHLKYSGKNKLNEWFDISIPELIEILYSIEFSRDLRVVLKCPQLNALFQSKIEENIDDE